MSLSKEQEKQVFILKKHRDEILKKLYDIEKIIQTHFPDEFDIAYQHWIPQIATALSPHDKWLPRGVQTMENMFGRIADKNSKYTTQSINKFI
jgi:hypothetical protein